MILFCLSASSTLTIFSDRFFSIALFLYPKCRATPPLFPIGFLSLCLPFFFPLLLCLLCAFAYFLPLQQKRVQAKMKTKWEAKNIPLLVHCFVHGSVPFLGEQSNWHHSHPCGTGQGCYVAQATIPNCVLGCWANEMDFLLSWSVWRSQ